MATEPHVEIRPIVAGEVLESAELGLHSTVLEATAQRLRSRVKATANGNGGPLHRHLRTEERFEVEAGTVRVRRGLRGSTLIGAGEEATIPAGVPHTFAVEGEAAVFVTEFRPPWLIAEFFQELFALPTGSRGTPRLRDLAVLMHRYPKDFFYAPVLPPAFQRGLTRPLVRLAGR